MNTRRQQLKKERAKQSRIFNQGLRKTPKIEPNHYYVADKNGHLKHVDAGEVKLDGITYEMTKNQFHELLSNYKDKLSLIDQANSTLTGILIANGYNTPNVELNALIEDILKLNIISPSKEYTGYKVVNGYVVGRGYDVIVVKGDDEPEDYDKGYWKIIDGKWELDNVRFQQIWGG